MRLDVKGRNVEVSPTIRRYAEEKFRRLERQLADGTHVEVEIALQTNRSTPEQHVAEATVWAKGSTLRARGTSAEIKASIDELVDKVERQVTRYREKRTARRRRPAREAES